MAVAAQTATLTVTYARPADPEQAEVLRLEQGAWAAYTGSVTKQEMVRAVAALVAKEDYTIKVACGMSLSDTGAALVCPIYAYPIPADLAYVLVTSYGQLSERDMEMVEATELVQFQLTDAASPQYPARTIVSASWAMDCLDAAGEVIAPPALTADGPTIRSAAVVYGTAEVTYLYERHTYILTAPRRAEALDKNFSAVLVAAIPGFTPVVLVVEMPPGIEAFEADANAVCGASWCGEIKYDDDEDHDTPEATTANLITEVDYCTQQVVREYTE